MESIRELRQMLQAEKIALRKEFWGYKTLSRGPSIYLTYPLLRTKVRPNQISLLVLVLGIVGALSMFIPGHWWKVFGLFLLYLNLVFDQVDGEIARYKKIFSLKGIYLDQINHLVVPGLFFGFLALSISRSSNLSSFWLVFAGIIGGLSWMGIKATSKMSYQIYLSKYARHKDIFKLPHEINEGNPNKFDAQKLPISKSLARKLLGARFQIREFFVAIFIFALVLIIEQFTASYPHQYPITSWLIVFYSIFLLLSFIEESIKGFCTIESRVQKIESNSR